MARKKQQMQHGDKPASLKTLAEHLGLSPATISVVLNDVPGRSIPQATRDRIKAAAEKLNYQPSLLARSAELFALVQNLFDARYDTFGTFFDTTQIAALNLSDPRSLSPGAPLAVFVGLRARF